jgi:hypothetical protein
LLQAQVPAYCRKLAGNEAAGYKRFAAFAAIKFGINEFTLLNCCLIAVYIH